MPPPVRRPGFGALVTACGAARWMLSSLGPLLRLTHSISSGRRLISRPCGIFADNWRSTAGEAAGLPIDAPVPSVP